MGSLDAGTGHADVRAASFDASPVPIFLHDPGTGAILDANEAAADLLGRDRDAIRELDVVDFVPDDDAYTHDRVVSLLSRAVEGGPITVDWEIQADGDHRFAEVDLRPVDHGDDTHVFAFVRDVGDRRTREQALEELQTVASELMEADSVEGIARITADAANRAIGYPLAGVRLLDPDTGCLELASVTRETEDTLQDDPPSYAAGEGFVGRAFERGEAVIQNDLGADESNDYGEIRSAVCVPLGDHGVLTLGSRKVGDFDGSDVQFARLLTRLTEAALEQTIQERRLQERTDHLEMTLGNAPVVLFTMDSEGTITLSKGSGLSALRLEPDEAVGRGVSELYGDFPAVVELCGRALDGESVNEDISFAGQTFDATLEPVFDDGGEVEQVIAVARDVTEIEGQRRELERQTSYLEMLVHNAPLVLFGFDGDGTITLSDGQGLEAIGFEPGELEGDSMFDVFADVPGVLDATERALDGEEVSATVELQGVTYETVYNPIVGEGGQVEQVVGVARDVTALKDRERRLKTIHEVSRELPYIHDPTRIAEEVAAVAGETTGRGMSVVWLEDGETGTLRPAATNAAADEFGGGEPFELRPIEPGMEGMDAFRDGDSRVIEDYGAVGEPFHTGPPLGRLYLAPLGDHGLLTVGSTSADPFEEAERSVIEVVTATAEAALDRAERERRLEDYRRELERSNERLQQFAYVASHDLQEPLRMVSSYVDLLDREYGDDLDGEAREYMDFAVDGANRMRDMINALLDYSRVNTQGNDPEPIDATAVLEGTMRNLSMMIEERGVEVEHGRLPTVRADPDQLGQVFQNLVENAIEHGGESPTVEVLAEDADADGMVTIAVEDNGKGIPPEEQEDIFEIFTQGRTDADGIGIGLAICERIVHRHGGEIWVDSEPGEGSTFRFTLRAAAGSEGDPKP